MYRTLLGLSLGLLVAAVLAGCGGGGGPAPDTGTTTYWPLALNNVWRYNYTEYTQESAVAAVQQVHGRHHARPRPAGVTLQDTTTQDVWTMTATAQIDGSTWYSLVSQYTGGDPSDPRYLQHGADGLQVRASLLDDPYYLLKLPLEVGTTWVDPLDDQITYKITSINGTTPTPPADTYSNCVVVTDTLTVSGEADDVITDWYAPNVGLVREERWQGATQIWLLVLTSYTLH